MKKLLKFAFAVGLFVTILLVTGFFVIQAKFPPEKIRSMVSEELTKVLHREASVEDASIGIWPPRVSVRGIRVANNPAAGFSSDPLFLLPEAVLKLDLSKLLQFQVTVDEISLKDMKLLYEVRADGATSIDGLGGEKKNELEKPEEPVQEPLDLSTLELPGTLNLNSFRIENASVEFRDRKAGTSIILGSINQEVALELDKTLENIKTTGKLTVDNVRLSDAASKIRTGKIHLEFSHDIAANLRKQEIFLNGLVFGFQKVKVKLHGSVKNFLSATPGIDISVKSNEIFLADMLREVPRSINPEIAKVSAAGSAHFEIAVKGNVGGEKLPKIKGMLDLKNLEFGHSDVPAKVNSMTGKIRFTESTVLIDPFGFKLDQHPVNVLVDISGLPAAPEVKQLKVNAKLELEPLLALASKVAPIPEGLKLSGRITTRLEVSGKIDPAHPENLKVQGETKLEQIHLETPQLPDPVDVNGQVKFGNTEIREKLVVKIGPSDLAVDVRIKDFLVMVAPELAKGKRCKVVIGVNSSNFEIDRLLPPGGSEEEPVPEEAGELPDVLPELPLVDVDMMVSLNRTVFKHLDLTNFRMKLKLLNNVMNMKLDASLYKGSIRQSLHADLKNPKQGIINFGLSLKNVEANDLISNGNNNITGSSPLEKKIRDADNTLYGKMNLDIKVKTSGVPRTFVENLAGDIDMKVFDGKLVGSNMAKGLNKAMNGNKFIKMLPSKYQVKMDDMKFSSYEAQLGIKDGSLIVKHVGMKKTPIGDLDLKGKIGFDTKLDLVLQQTLPPAQSKQLKSVVQKGTGAAAGALSKIKGAGKIAKAAANYTPYPMDKKSNAQFFWKLGGTMDNPSYGLDNDKMVGAAGGGASDIAGEALNDLKNAAKAKLNAAKELAEQKKKELEAKAKAAAAKLKKKADAQKKKLQAKADKAKKKAKKKANKAKKKGKKKAKKKAKELLKKNKIPGF